MKRLVLIAVALMIWAVSSALPTSSVLLQHKGEVKTFTIEKIQDAINQAVSGDTVYLSRGVYPSFTITRRIVIRGEGSGVTHVDGDITLEISSDQTDMETVIKGLSAGDSKEKGGIKSTIPMRNLSIKQCSFRYLNLSPYYDNSNIRIDRCVIWENLYLRSRLSDLTVTNSKIHHLYLWAGASPNSVTCVNCNIYDFVHTSDFKGTLMNCIIGAGPATTTGTMSGCTMINSLIHRIYNQTSSGSFENCWTSSEEDGLLVEENGNALITDDYLKEKGYIGNDGTVIGANGGANPFTLDLAVPKVERADVKLDAAKGLLNIDLKLTPSKP